MSFIIEIWKILTWNIFLGPVSKEGVLPNESICEEPSLDPIPTFELEKQTRNKQQKTNWENRCQRTIEKAIMFGGKPWNVADQKAFSQLGVSIGKEGRKQLHREDSYWISKS